MATERYEEAKYRVLAVGEARLLHEGFLEKAALVYCSAHNSDTRVIAKTTFSIRSPSLATNTRKDRSTRVVFRAIERYEYYRKSHPSRAATLSNADTVATCRSWRQAFSQLTPFSSSLQVFPTASSIPCDVCNDRLRAQPTCKGSFRFEKKRTFVRV